MESFDEALRHERAALNHEIRKRRTKRVRRAIAGLAICSVAGAGVAGFGYLDKSGEVTAYPAVEHQLDIQDNNLRIDSENMQNKVIVKANDIKKLLQERDPDVLVMQEVNYDDASLLPEYFPEMHIYYGLADTKQQPLSGGYGDVIMSKEPLKDVKSVPIPGDSAPEYLSNLATGLGKDTISTIINQNPTLKHSRSRVSENREALSGTLTVQVGDEEQNIRIVTSHIAAAKAGNEHKIRLHEAQLNKLLSTLAHSGDKVAFCGDENTEPPELAQRIANIKFIGLWPRKRTSLNNNVIIDGCATRGIGLGYVHRLIKYKTDHYAIELNVPLQEDKK